MSSTEHSWTKSLHGYAIAAIGATLTKDGKRWVLCVQGERHTLPRRASFDHAETILAEKGLI